MTNAEKSSGGRAAKSVAVLLVLASCSAARGQAPGTVLPGPTDASDYARATDPLIDDMKALLDKIPAPPGVLDEADKAAAQSSLSQVRSLADARAAAEAISNNGQNAFLPQTLSKPEAKFSANQINFLRGLSIGDSSVCKSGLLSCNGIPSEHGSVECTVAVPDPAYPSGRRNAGVLTIQCLPEGGKLVGHIVAALPDLNSYSGPHVTHDGIYLTYHGKPFAGFCTPCP